MIESKQPPGIFAILNDVCATMHAVTNSADEEFKKVNYKFLSALTSAKIFFITCAWAGKPVGHVSFDAFMIFMIFVNRLVALEQASLMRVGSIMATSRF